ncbi:hypothetical protein HYPSUDRAFT_139471 [Hypholoma sublateritium FD-334 SS-4]|uniref:Uncharacterized protein n=1 Tax=Hypholoma sublateritium (strain FD-334 SS-4) TaxID=945553 RepID=A0A0D2PQV1_HYPSF|nr:hypothetical protein HYPSUDRAFT_139471 [Hypholoma sublateritium FD-334 SS-4]
MPSHIASDLFPVPSQHQVPNKEVILARPRPGVSVSSTTTLREALTDDHKRWHVYFNDKGFHNHTAHAVLTLWALGAESSIVKASYDDHATYQRAACESPAPITRATWKGHLGDEIYYTAYLRFFEGEVKTKSVSAILEEYIYSPHANFVGEPGREPHMATRFLEGLLHPIIHTGLGIEFGLPGVFAEGLAQTAVHRSDISKMAPPRWFETHGTADLASQFTKAVGLADKGPTRDVHAFSILARVLNDPKFRGIKQPQVPVPIYYRDFVEAHGDAIAKYVDEWTLDGDLDKKVHELLWVNALLYGVGGATNKHDFKPDFVLMHLVTSSLFISEVFVEVSRPSQVVLLRSYFASSLAWFIMRGNPPLDIAAFFGDPQTAHPHAPGPQPSPNDDAKPSAAAAEAVTPNGWNAILQSTLVHPDDHQAKIQRALSEFAIHFGLTPAGTFADTELEGAEFIDGSLFIRTAGLTLGKMGWVREGEAAKAWDMSGFYVA